MHSVPCYVNAGVIVCTVLGGYSSAYDNMPPLSLPPSLSPPLSLSLSPLHCCTALHRTAPSHCIASHLTGGRQVCAAAGQSVHRGHLHGCHVHTTGQRRATHTFQHWYVCMWHVHVLVHVHCVCVDVQSCMCTCICACACACVSVQCSVVGSG